MKKMKTLKEILDLLDHMKKPSRGPCAVGIAETSPAALRQVDQDGNNITHLRPYHPFIEQIMAGEGRIDELNMLKATPNKMGKTHYDIVFERGGIKELTSRCALPVLDHLTYENQGNFLSQAASIYLATLQDEETGHPDYLPTLLRWVPAMVNSSTPTGMTVMGHALKRGRCELLDQILDIPCLYMGAHYRCLENLGTERLWCFRDLLVVAKLLWYPMLPVHICEKILGALSERNRAAIRTHIKNILDEGCVDEHGKYRKIREWRKGIGKSVSSPMEGIEWQ